MKKLCLILLLFSWISVMPSFAAKIIVNDTDDRRVPSRSSGPEAFVQYYEVGDDYVDSYGQAPKHNGGYQLEKYKNQNLPLLKEDIRLELVGTTWEYHDEAQDAAYAEANSQASSIDDVYDKRYHREAADYYTMDTIKNPNALIPCGDAH